MGNKLSAACSCGYSAHAIIGSSRGHHGRVFMYPHHCKACPDLVNADLLFQPVLCPHCRSYPLTRYGRAVKATAEAEGKASESIVDTSYCYNLKTEFQLPVTGNPCPMCGQSSLTFQVQQLFD